MIALRSGYYFGIVKEDDVSRIPLTKTYQVRVHDITYDLMELDPTNLSAMDVRKFLKEIDKILDDCGTGLGYEIDEYKIKEPRD